MIETQIKCDVCKAERGPANHWLLVRDLEQGLVEDASLVYGIGVFPWSDTIAKGPAVRHICGSVCAHKVLDRYLESLRNGESS